MLVPARRISGRLAPEPLPPAVLSQTYVFTQAPRLSGRCIRPCRKYSFRTPLLRCPTESDALRFGTTLPAAQWVDALPIGNVRLGAMVFGGGVTNPAADPPLSAVPKLSKAAAC
jgi:hypothetical protein